MYKLIITTITNRVLFMSAIRKACRYLSISDVSKIDKQLPYTIEELFWDPEQISIMFNGNCEYTYQEYIDYKEADYSCVPPWERKEYVDAKNWYLTLPKEDRDKIDILVSSNAS